jgi:hypothetical protein
MDERDDEREHRAHRQRRDEDRARHEQHLAAHDGHPRAAEPTMSCATWTGSDPRYGRDSTLQHAIAAFSQKSDATGRARTNGSRVATYPPRASPAMNVTSVVVKPYVVEPIERLTSRTQPTSSVSEANPAKP